MMRTDLGTEIIGSTSITAGLIAVTALTPQTAISLAIVQGRCVLNSGNSLQPHGMQPVSGTDSKCLEDLRWGM